MRAGSWVIVACCVLALNVSAARAENVPVAVPKGTVTQHSFKGSKIFPGTERNYWVYVPSQYDSSKPACVWVNQDGIQANAPEVFDRLIAAKEMPVTVGIFVNAGTVRAPNGDALARIERGNEYDSLGDRYVRFLLDELLPHIAADQKLNLSDSGNDRGIGGASSGGACAFTAAWERPDAFTRVFTSVGTYVNARGAGGYPTLVRLYEPKPLRVFLQDGTHDLNIYMGDWWMANNEMERALIYSGYEVNHLWTEGGHGTGEWTGAFPDVMRWLWKDWPAPVKIGRGSGPIQELLPAYEAWKQVGDKYKSVHGLAADHNGTVYFNDAGASVGYKVGGDGKPVEFLKDTAHGTAQSFGPDGRLFTCAGTQVRAYSPDGKFNVIAEGIRGSGLVVLHDGGIYVTESARNDESGKLWHINPKGEKKLVDADLDLPNGITVSPDQTLLYVDDRKSHWIWSYQIQPDGSLAYKEKFFWLHEPAWADDSAAGGMCCDREGHLYVATRMGIQVHVPSGAVICIIPIPGDKATHLCFGGPQFDTLYATGGDKVYRRKFNLPGANPFDAPFKPIMHHPAGYP